MMQNTSNVHPRPQLMITNQATISSPHSRAATANQTNLRNLNNDLLLLHQRCTVYVGKKQYSINLTPLEDVSVATWKKQREFDQLETAVISLRNTHQVADLMELVCQEIPLDVDSAAQDATNFMATVLTNACIVENLNASVFLTCTGNEAQLTSKKLADRPENIAFFCFTYNLDPSTIDP